MDDNINITIDVNAELKKLNSTLMKSLERSSILAQIAHSLGKLPKDMKLPESNIIGIFRYLYLPEIGQSDEKFENQLWVEMKDEFGQYCTRCAVVGMIAAFEVYLQRLYFYAKLAEAINNSGGKIMGSEYHNINSHCMKYVRHLAVDSIVKKICKTLRIEQSQLPPLDAFTSAYRLRICLLHRNGIVGEEDVDDKNVLRTTWKKPVISVDGKDIESLPYDAKKGQEIHIRLEDEIKVWNIGDNIILSVENAQHIAFNLGWLAKDLSGKMINGISALSDDRQ